MRFHKPITEAEKSAYYRKKFIDEGGWIVLVRLGSDAVKKVSAHMKRHGVSKTLAINNLINGE